MGLEAMETAEVGEKKMRGKARRAEISGPALAGFFPAN